MSRSTGPLIATLPMYDWAAVRPATDSLWAALCSALRTEGWNAPVVLNRDEPSEELWRSPRLIFGQTCGLPYVYGLRDLLTLIGTPDYGLPDCPPGWYRSAIVMRAADPRDDLAAFRGATLAVNAKDSQSGALAMMHAVTELARHRAFFDVVRLSGSHANSIRMVADGRADIAAIDTVTWRLAKAYQAEARHLRVLATTAAAPGLPYVAARGFEGESLATAVEAGIATLDPMTKASLGLQSFVRIRPDDYNIIAERAAAAAQISAAHGLLPNGYNNVRETANA